MTSKFAMWLPFLAVAILTVVGQLLVKAALTKHGVIPEPFSDKLYYLFKVLLDPLIIVGFFLAFLAAMFWLAIMSRFDLSYAYPYMIGVLTLATTMAGYFVLGEKLTATTAAGTGLIVLGVVCMSIQR